MQTTREVFIIHPKKKRIRFMMRNRAEATFYRQALCFTNRKHHKSSVFEQAIRLEVVINSVALELFNGTEYFLPAASWILKISRASGFRGLIITASDENRKRTTSLLEGCNKVEIPLNGEAMNWMAYDGVERGANYASFHYLRVHWAKLQSEHFALNAFKASHWEQFVQFS